MKKVFIGKEELTLENNKISNLKYYMLEQPVVNLETKENIISYGFEIENETNGYVENEFVSDVTTIKEDALYMAECLKRNQVTSTHLKDVISDIL